MLNWCHLESLFWISTLHIFLWYRTIHVCRLWTNSSVCTAAQLLTAWAGKAWTSNCEPARFQFQSGLSDTHLSICVCVWPRPLQPKSFEKGLAHEAGLKSYRGRWVSASKKNRNWVRTTDILYLQKAFIHIHPVFLWPHFTPVTPASESPMPGPGKGLQRFVEEVGHGVLASKHLMAHLWNVVATQVFLCHFSKWKIEV